MTPETFVDNSLMYRIHVEDSTKDGLEKQKPEALIYSRVTEILEVFRQ